MIQNRDWAGQTFSWPARSGVKTSLPSATRVSPGLTASRPRIEKPNKVRPRIEAPSRNPGLKALKEPDWRVCGDQDEALLE